MRPTTLFSVFSRASRRSQAATHRARKTRLAAAERLEERINLTATIVDLAASRAASENHAAYDQLPIPAGATLVDVSDSGRYVLFSSTDTNVIAGQQTIPSINPDLFWLDTATGQTRLVTHRAGSPVQSAGYAGLEGFKYFPGYGQWPMFEPLSADLSGDGRSVVFDSIIAANEYDASVPVENDQATYRPVKRDATTDTWKNFQLGTVDVFVWRADGDAANSIALVSRLNAEGQQQAVATNSLVPGLPVPKPGQPMATGVFAQEYLPVLPDNFQNLVQQDAQESLSLNKGISEDGTRVLYDSWVPAGWIDVVRPGILDQEAISVNAQGQGAGSDWTLDSFVASTTGFGGGPWAAKTVTVNVDATQALGNYTGPAIGQGAWAEPFEPMFSQMSGDGKRVVYSTRRTSAEIVTGTTDSDFSLDVFASDVDSSTNLLVSRKWDDATKAAGSAQPNLFDGSVRPFVRNFVAELWDSQNHSVSNDGRTIAFTSSAGNLVEGWKDVTADFSEPVIVGGSKWTAFQPHPIDIYGFQFASASPTVPTGKAVLVNSPDGLANTNRIATFGGMSADGSSFLFSTAANNFYLPGFTSPYPFTQNLPQAPLPLNFILGGFDNLWMRRVDWAAGAKGVTTLVSVGFNVDADGKPDINGKPNAAGNKATLGSPTPAGSRDVLNTISQSGRYVMFSSKANNLVQGISDRSFKGGVFIRDTVANRTTLLTTTATGNVPSAGLFVNSAIASDDKTSRFASYVDGTGASDMQTRFRTEDVAPGPTSHVYRIDYPAVSNAASATNPAIFTVASADFKTDVNTRPVLEFRDQIPLITPSVKTSPGQLLPNYAGEWRTATGDINADGVVDYVYGAGPGGRDKDQLGDLAGGGDVQARPRRHGGGRPARRVRRHRRRQQRRLRRRDRRLGRGAAERGEDLRGASGHAPPHACAVRGRGAGRGARGRRRRRCRRVRRRGGGRRPRRRGQGRCLQRPAPDRREGDAAAPECPAHVICCQGRNGRVRGRGRHESRRQGRADHRLRQGPDREHLRRPQRHAHLQEGSRHGLPDRRPRGGPGGPSDGRVRGRGQSDDPALRVRRCRRGR